MIYDIGIDPGITNLGLAVIDQEDSLVLSATLKPKDYPTLFHFTDHVRELIQPYTISSCGIEKYVVYGSGTPASCMIDTVMLVGSLAQMFYDKGVDPHLVKAIDWKKTIAKDLFKTRKFRNPSTRFDKKFSMAAATAICNETLPTDHEADAVGVAYFSRIQNASGRQHPAGNTTSIQHK